MVLGFGKLKSRFSGSVAKLSGRKDFLEAVCAAAALVAAADGEIEEEEIKETIQSILNNPQLSGAFDTRTIEETADQMFKRARGVSGKMGLYKEIDDIAGETEMSEAVYAIALDISMSDGEMEPQEKAVLSKISARLRVDPSKFDV